MNPKDLAANLRRIASSIDNSENPSKNLVVADLSKIICHLDENRTKIAATESELEDRIKNLMINFSIRLIHYKDDISGDVIKLVEKLENPDSSIRSEFNGFSDEELKIIADNLKYKFSQFFFRGGPPKRPEFLVRLSPFDIPKTPPALPPDIPNFEPIESTEDSGPEDYLEYDDDLSPDASLTGKEVYVLIENSDVLGVYSTQDIASYHKKNDRIVVYRCTIDDQEFKTQKIKL